MLKEDNIVIVLYMLMLFIFSSVKILESFICSEHFKNQSFKSLSPHIYEEKLDKFHVLVNILFTVLNLIKLCVHSSINIRIIDTSCLLP